MPVRITIIGKPKDPLRKIKIPQFNRTKNTIIYPPILKEITQTGDILIKLPPHINISQDINRTDVKVQTLRLMTKKDFETRT